MKLRPLQYDLSIKDVIEIVTNLGADRYEEHENFVIFPTICHNVDSSEANMKLYYYDKNHMFHCYTECNENFTIFQLFEKYYELHQIEYNFLNDIYFVILNYVTTGDKEGFIEETYKSKKSKYNHTEEIVLPEYSDNVLSIFSEHRPQEWIDEGITPESMSLYNIKYYGVQNKAIIPHYDINDRLVGIRGRTFNEWEIQTSGKYRPITIEGITYTHPLSLNLYGFNISFPSILSRRTAIIFEGEKSCLKYNSMFDDNVSVAVCGSSLNKYQIRLLYEYARPQEIVLAFDKEYHKTNSPEAEKYFQNKLDLCQKYGNYGNMSFIYDQDGLLNMKDAPVDQGREVFLELYNRRVKI